MGLLAKIFGPKAHELFQTLDDEQLETLLDLPITQGVPQFVEQWIKEKGYLEREATVEAALQACELSNLADEPWFRHPGIRRRYAAAATEIMRRHGEIPKDSDRTYAPVFLGNLALPSSKNDQGEQCLIADDAKVLIARALRNEGIDADPQQILDLARGTLRTKTHNGSQRRYSDEELMKRARLPGGSNATTRHNARQTLKARGIDWQTGQPLQTDDTKNIEKAH